MPIAAALSRLGFSMVWSPPRAGEISTPRRRSRATLPALLTAPARGTRTRHGRDYPRPAWRAPPPRRELVRGSGAMWTGAEERVAHRIITADVAGGTASRIDALDEPETSLLNSQRRRRKQDAASDGRDRAPRAGHGLVMTSDPPHARRRTRTRRQGTVPRAVSRQRRAPVAGILGLSPRSIAGFLQDLPHQQSTPAKSQLDDHGAWPAPQPPEASRSQRARSGETTLGPPRGPRPLPSAANPADLRRGVDLRAVGGALVVSCALLDPVTGGKWPTRRARGSKSRVPPARP